jgi:hypothetical protein
VRASRRRQAEDALAFERDREAMLAGELEDLLAQIVGGSLDAALYALLSPEDVALVRAALAQDADELSGDDPHDADDDDTEAFDFAFLDDDEDDDALQDDDDPEAEVARLQEEIDGSRQVQAALVRYLELLGTPSPAPSGQAGS